MRMRKGKCLNCGRCCSYDKLWQSLSFKHKLFIFLIKGFRVFKIKNFRCQNVILKNGKWFCRIYSNRPQFCRDYPASTFDLIDNSCGFKFEKN